MLSLEWRTSEPRPNPFEAIAGDLTEYRVHFATSAASAHSDLKRHLIEVVHKAISFAKENVGDNVSRMLFLWDGVYAILTVVCTDEKMERDAHHVISCQFSAIDEQLSKFLPPGPAWSAALNEFSSRVRRFLEGLAAAGHLDEIPASIGVYYSDQDRASLGSSDILVHRLTRRFEEADHRSAFLGEHSKAAGKEFEDWHREITFFEATFWPFVFLAIVTILFGGATWLSYYWTHHPPRPLVGKPQGDELVLFLRWAGPLYVALAGAIPFAGVMGWLMKRIIARPLVKVLTLKEPRKANRI